MTFPVSPVLNQVYTDEASNQVFIWDGDKWVTTGGGANFVQGATGVTGDTGDTGATGLLGPVGATGPVDPNATIVDIIDDTSYPPAGDQGGLTFVMVQNTAGDSTEPLLKDAAGISFNADGNEFQVNTIIAGAVNIDVGLNNDGGSTTIGVTTCSLVDATGVDTYEVNYYAKIADNAATPTAGALTSVIAQGKRAVTTPGVLTLVAGGGRIVVQLVNQLFTPVTTVEVTVRYKDSSNNQSVCYDELTFVSTGFNQGTTAFTVYNKNGEEITLGTPSGYTNYIPNTNCVIGATFINSEAVVALYSLDSNDGEYTASCVITETYNPAGPS